MKMMEIQQSLAKAAAMFFGLFIFIITTTTTKFVEGAVSNNGMNVGSPCPTIFQYESDGVEWYGIITAPSLPYGSTARLIARLSIGRVLPTKYAGSLDLIGPRAEVLHAMLTEQPIRYRVNFPLPHPLPVVTSITLNDRLICSGTPVTGPIVTSITLEHTLYPHTQTLNTRGKPSIPQEQFAPNIPNTEDILIKSEPISSPSIFGILPSEIEKNPSSNNKLNLTNFFYPNLNNNVNRINLTSYYNPDLNNNNNNKPLINNTVATNLYTEICGLGVNIRPLIANGEVTKKGSHPWLVAIFAQKMLGLEFTCGGTLISTKFVITAAHCIRYGENRALAADEIVVVLGKYRIRRWTERGSVVRDAAKVHLHPDYRALSGDADLAAIELSESVEFTDRIRPVCLWQKLLTRAPPSVSEDLIGHEATIIGWGRDETGQKVTPEPRQTKVRVVSQEECLRSRLEFRYITSNRTLCAGGIEPGSGPCSGDSGGGLFLRSAQEGRWYLRGVISMSLADPLTKSCDLQHYSVFVDLNKFDDWIMQFVH